MAHAVEGRPSPAGRSEPSTPAGAPPESRVRRGFFHLGELLLTLGVVVLLFVVYEVWITNIWADRNNEHNISALRNEYDTVAGLPGNGNSTIPLGTALGILYIPRLGRDYAEAIVQGSAVPDDNQLEQGAAHYGNTQLPGQVGNFAVAGHRVGKGEPFLNIDKLRSGDAVIVETRKTWFVYQVFGTPVGGNPETDAAGSVRVRGHDPVSLHGRQIIEPADGQVLLPIPNHPEYYGGTKTPASFAVDRLMTMTTCHPKFTASHRMIIFSKLAASVPALANSSTSKASQMPASIAKLYDEVKI